MNVSMVAGSQTLLNYSLSTQPDPLTVSPSTGSPSVGTLTLIVSNGGDRPVWLDTITIEFEVSALAQALTNDGSNISVAASPSSLWNPRVVSRSSTFTIEVSPNSGAPVEVTTEGIAVYIYAVPINETVGTACVDVLERSSYKNSGYTNRKGTLEVGKFPAGFFFSNFTAQTPEVANGDPVTLSWAGQESAVYYLSYGDGAPVNVSNTRSYTTQALHSDTTFLLQATYVENAETVNAYLTTSVDVSKPDINATSVSVSGPLTAGGVVTAQSDTAIGGNLAVSQATALNTLSVTGATNLASTVVNSLTAASATVSGQTSLASLSVNSVVKMLGTTPQPLTAGTYTPTTDGLVIGQIIPPGQVDNGVKYCASIMSSSTGGLVANTFGGWVINFIDSSYYYYAPQPGALCLPATAGQSFAINWAPISASHPPPTINCTYAAWFLPFGAGTAASGAAVLTGPPPEIDLAATAGHIAARSHTSTKSINDATDAFAQAIPGGLPADKRRALEAALTDLFSDRVGDKA